MGLVLVCGNFKWKNLSRFSESIKHTHSKEIRKFEVKTNLKGLLKFHVLNIVQLFPLDYFYMQSSP